MIENYKKKSSPNKKKKGMHLSQDVVVVLVMPEISSTHP